MNLRTGDLVKPVSIPGSRPYVWPQAELFELNNPHTLVWCGETTAGLLPDCQKFKNGVFLLYLGKLHPLRQPEDRTLHRLLSTTGKTYHISDEDIQYLEIVQ